MTTIRDLFLLLPFVLTGGALVAYGLVMTLFAVYRSTRSSPSRRSF